MVFASCQQEEKVPFEGSGRYHRGYQFNKVDRTWAVASFIEIYNDQLSVLVKKEILFPFLAERASPPCGKQGAFGLRNFPRDKFAFMRVMHILLPHQEEAVIRQPRNQHMNSVILNLNTFLLELPLVSLHFVD